MLDGYISFDDAIGYQAIKLKKQFTLLNVLVLQQGLSPEHIFVYECKVSLSCIITDSHRFSSLCKCHCANSLVPC